MRRRNRLAVVCHCILNQNSVVYDLARAGGAFYSVAAALLRQGYGIYQLPCPELAHGGMKRLPMSHEQYDTPDYHAICDEIVEKALSDLDALKDGGAEVGVLIGVRCSPTCSVSGLTGHLQKRLAPELTKRFPGIRLLEIPEDYIEGQPHRFDQELIEAL